MPTTIANSGSPQAAPAHTASLGRRGLLRASGLGVLVVALSSVEGPAALARAPNTLGNVTILATGGTIAGSGATSTTTVGYTAATVGVDALLNSVPELKKVANVRGEQVFQIASENMNNDYWLKLAKRVNTLLAQDDVDGIVITHGTDTIEETAYFLDLVVKSRKPVVIVGAMRPSTAISADGPINLYNATLVAASEEAIGKGVLVVLNDQINAARDVTKSNTSTADTFRTPDLGMLGYVQGNKPYFYHLSARKNTGHRVRHRQPGYVATGRYRLWLREHEPYTGGCVCIRWRQGVGARGCGRRQPGQCGQACPHRCAQERCDHRAQQPRRLRHRGAQW